MTAHYLPADALHLLAKLLRLHRLVMLMAGLLLWSIVTAILSWRVHRWGLDTLIFAFVISVALVFIAACLYLLSHHSGYHFLGS